MHHEAHSFCPADQPQPNGKWDWPQIVTGTALAELFCPPVEEPERVVLARGSTAH